MSITICARDDRNADILIFGPIGDELMGNGVTADRVESEMKALGNIETIRLKINSPGGALFDGVAIFNLLKRHPARIEVDIIGLAASSASLIAMAGDRVTMGIGTQFMLHNPWQLAVGDADDLRKSADILDQIRDGMADAYASRTGLPRNHLIKLMDAETWLGADEAVNLGFADEVAEGPTTQSNAFSAAWACILARYRKSPNGASSMTNPVADFQAAERDRRQQIRSLFGRKVVEAHRALLEECLDDMAITPQMASKRLLDALGAGAEPLRSSFVDPRETDFRAAAADALLQRAGVSIVKPAAGARDLRYMSVLDIARACLSQSNTGSHGLGSPTKIIKAALSTSDFPAILENAMGKALRAGYEADPQSHVLWVKRSQVSNFKTQSRLLLGSAPPLQRVAEGGEYKYGSLTENKATLLLEKFGRLISLTWETLINDDLSAFINVPNAMGAAARRAEADEVYALFTANSGAGMQMQDGVNLFDAAHTNVSATTGAVSIATLGAARTLLRKQQAIGNGGYLNLAPRFLIVPAESETAAEQVLAQATRNMDRTASATTVSSTTTTVERGTDSTSPEWITRLQLVVEPRLDSAHGFYVAAHYSQIDTCELATLEADDGAPYIEEEDEFARDAKHYKVRHSFDAKFIDWKGIVRVPVSG